MFLKGGVECKILQNIFVYVYSRVLCSFDTPKEELIQQQWDEASYFHFFLKLEFENKPNEKLICFFLLANLVCIWLCKFHQN